MYVKQFALLLNKLLGDTCRRLLCLCKKNLAYAEIDLITQCKILIIVQ